MKKRLLTLVLLITLFSAYALRAASPVLFSGLTQTSDPTELIQYAGKYKFEGLPFEFITITVKEGKLNINTGTEEGFLTPLKDPDTFGAAGRATLTFKRDSDKKIIGMVLAAQGMNFEGKKEVQ